MAGGIQLDTSIAVRKFSANVGNGARTSIAVTHNLGTKDIAGGGARYRDQCLRHGRCGGNRYQHTDPDFRGCAGVECLPRDGARLMATAYLGTGLERVADVRLATDIPAQHLGATVNAIRTSGYSAHGRGPGLYVNDAQANAGLAAAHPRICKQSADGRYWRLSVEDGLDVLQLGAAADNTADDGPIAVAALAYLEHVANTQAAIGYGRGAPRLVYPAGNYYLGTSTLDIRYSAIIEGDNGGGPSGGGSTLRWADNTTGIRTQSYNTEGASADAGVNHLGSAGTIIRNLYLRGGYAGTESESHGVQLRCPARLEHLIIDNFGGDGVFGKAGVGSNPYRGQTNGSAFFNVAVIQCRNGFFFDLSDSNNVNFYSCTLNSNRRYGAWHNTGLNVNWVGCDFSTKWF